MTYYNTGNPVPSANPKDFYDNAQTMDRVVNQNINSTTTRTQKHIYTFAGMEYAFNQFLLQNGYVDLGNYQAGLVIDFRNKIFVKDGSYFRIRANVTLPYITTGNWASESANFLALSDQTLRSDLLLPSGALLVSGGTAVHCDSVSDMVLRDFEVGQTIITKGYYTEGDGGGASYRITTGTGDGYINLNLNNGRLAQLIFNNRIDIRQAGAKGDGVFLNHVPIQKCLDLFPFGGVVTVPDGLFKIGQTLKINSGVKLIGDNPLTSVISAVDTTFTVVENSINVRNDRFGNIAGNTGGQFSWEVSNLTLHGGQTGLWLKRGYFFKSENLYIRNCAGYGIKMGTGTSNLTGCYWCNFTNCKIYLNDGGVFITDFTNLNTFINCQFNNTSYNVYFAEPTPNNVLGMETNAFISCEFAGNASPTCINVMLDARIAGVYFRNCYSENKTLTITTGTAHAVKNLVWDGGLMAGSNRTASFVAPQNSAVCTNWVIKDTYFNFSKAVGVGDIYVFDMTANSYYWSLTNNRFEGTGLGLYNPVDLTDDKWETDNQLAPREVFARDFLQSRVIKNYGLKGLRKSPFHIFFTAHTGDTVRNDGDIFNLFEIDRFVLLDAYSSLTVEVSGVCHDLTNVRDLAFNLKYFVSASSTTLRTPTVVSATYNKSVTANAVLNFTNVSGKIVCNIQVTGAQWRYLNLTCSLSATGEFIDPPFLLTPAEIFVDY